MYIRKEMLLVYVYDYIFCRLFFDVVVCIENFVRFGKFC